MQKYVKVWEEEAIYPCLMELVAEVYRDELKEVSGYSQENAFISSKNSIAMNHITENDVAEINKIGEKHLGNRESFERFILIMHKLRKEFHEFISLVLEKNFSELSNEDILNLFSIYTKKWKQVVATYMCTEPERTHLIESTVQNYFKETYGQKGLEYFAVLTKPDTELNLNKESILVLKSFNEQNIDPKSYDFKKLNQINWFFEEPEKEKNRIRKESILNSIQIDDKIGWYIEVIKRISNERLKTRIFWMEGLYYVELFFNGIASRFELRLGDFKNYRKDDIYNLLKNSKRVSKELIEKRKKCSLLVMKNKNIEFHEGEKTIEMTNEIIPNSEEQNIISGQCANPGFMRGYVKLISFSGDKPHSEIIKEMKKGDILVTQMTRPNIILACEKASAIVTDEGGLTSHAAVIARELNIPCVVSTKTATKILKDGDLIEVYAEKGIVKKIN